MTEHAPVQSQVSWPPSVSYLLRHPTTCPSTPFRIFLPPSGRGQDLISVQFTTLDPGSIFPLHLRMPEQGAGPVPEAGQPVPLVSRAARAPIGPCSLEPLARVFRSVRSRRRIALWPRSRARPSGLPLLRTFSNTRQCALHPPSEAPFPPSRGGQVFCTARSP